MKSPVEVLGFLLAWFPVVVIAMFLIGFVVSMAREIWKGDE